jgi:glycosyltransferase involved in cell wall biosynthesis
MTEPPLLQICPNDHTPFLDICAVYQAAALRLGRQLITVFLSPASAEPQAEAVYLDAATLRHNRPVAARLDSELATLLGSPRFALAICHRYRAYRVLRASRFSSSPTVVIAHEFGFFDRWRRRLDRQLFAREVRFAGVSPPVVEELARTVAAPLLMPNGIDLERTRARRAARPASLAALGLSGERFNIGVVGRLHPKKQPQLALAGVGALVDALPSAHLLFIGDGELERELRKAAADLPISFAGFVAEAARYVGALDVLLVPSGEREAFSMVALEAMAAGVAVVAGPTPGPHFVLGDAGYYFDDFTAADLAAAVMAVHEDRDRSSERLVRGVERAEREFSVAAVARRLQTLLEQGVSTASPLPEAGS